MQLAHAKKPLVFSLLPRCQGLRGSAQAFLAPAASNGICRACASDQAFRCEPQEPVFELSHLSVGEFKAQLGKNWHNRHLLAPPLDELHHLPVINFHAMASSALP